MSVNGLMDKEDVVHIYNGILLSHKKEWNNAICHLVAQLVKNPAATQETLV